MFPRACCLGRLFGRMSRQTLTPGQSITPGLYLRVAASTSAPETFDPDSNPMFKKYAAKLEHLKLAQPQVYEERMTKLRAMYEKPTEPAEDASAATPENVEKSSVSQTKTESLDSIIKLELLADRTVDEIEQIWREYHSKTDYVYAIIPGDHYKEMKRRAIEYSTFLYPVPRGTGYELFVQQFNNDTWHFTTLAALQTHQENAPSCLSLRCYTELMAEKDVVLMRGEPDKNIISVHEAQLVALQVKVYYGVNSGLKFNLVRQFNNSPQDFRYQDVIKEFDNYKQDSKEYQIEKGGA